MDELDVFARLGLALAIGFGVGIERGHSQRMLPAGARALGIRSFAFVALTGGAAGLTAAPLGPWLVLACGLGVVALATAAYLSNLKRTQDAGLTTEIAAVAVYAAGVLSGLGLLLAAALTGLAAIVLLHNKSELHRFVERLEHAEIDAALKVLAAAAILLPLAPDRGFGPGGVLNPYQLLWAVVVIAAIGLCGHGAMRVWGAARGALAMGFLGGMVSSTGVTVSAAGMARTQSGGEAQLAAAIGVAQGVMFVRTILLALALNPALGLALAWPLAAGCAAACAGAFWIAGRDPNARAAQARGSPDTLNGAMRFVAVAACALVLAHWATQAFGVAGLYLSSALAGLVDVDAATAAVAGFARPGAEPAGPALFAALLALTANSVSKSAIAWRMGGPKLGAAASGVLLSSALAAIVAALAMTLIRG